MSTIDKVEEMQAVSTHIHSFDRSCDNRCMLSVRRRARYVFVMSLTGQNQYYISIGEIEVYGVGGNLGDRRLLSTESYSLCALTPVLPVGTNLARAWATSGVTNSTGICCRVVVVLSPDFRGPPCALLLQRCEFATFQFFRFF